MPSRARGGAFRRVCRNNYTPGATEAPTLSTSAIRIITRTCSARRESSTFGEVIHIIHNQTHPLPPDPPPQFYRHHQSLSLTCGEAGWGHATGLATRDLQRRPRSSLARPGPAGNAPAPLPPSGYSSRSSGTVDGAARRAPDARRHGGAGRLRLRDTASKVGEREGSSSWTRGRIPWRRARFPPCVRGRLDVSEPISPCREATVVVTCLPLIAGGGPGIIRSSGALLLPRASSHPLAGNGTPPETPLPVDQSGIPGGAARSRAQERRGGADWCLDTPRAGRSLLGRLSGERWPVSAAGPAFGAFV